MMSRLSGRVLILGGTAEARALAAELVALKCTVVSSLAGRVRNPALPAGEVRIGGFSTASLDGIGGLAAYLVEQHIAAVVDATHPFAAKISANAAESCTRTGTPLIRLQRPGWRTHPDADRWLWVDSIDDAVEAGAAYERPFLTTGRQSLSVFAEGWTDKDVTVRVVDPPEFALPPRWQLIRSRGPYAYADEHALMKAAHTDLLVTKDSGGTHTAAKLDAARDLGIQVLVIARPTAVDDLTQVSTIAEVLAFLERGRLLSANPG